jgi:hypothetical protein
MDTENREKKRTNPQPNCLCRRCDTCIENARWDRIFREELADPSCYSRHQAGNSLPMAARLTPWEPVAGSRPAQMNAFLVRVRTALLPRP